MERVLKEVKLVILGHFAKGLVRQKMVKMSDFGGDFHRTTIVRKGRIFKISRTGHFWAFFKR